MIAGQAVVSLVCYIAFSFIKAAAKDSIERDLPALFDKLEDRLTQKTGKAILVKAIRERVEGILKKL
jgi:hypothetical protein